MDIVRQALDISFGIAIVLDNQQWTPYLLYSLGPLSIDP